jgi:hypothetical protein
MDLDEWLMRQLHRLRAAFTLVELRIVSLRVWGYAEDEENGKSANKQR